MRYLLPLFSVFVLIGCGDPVPVAKDEPRDPLIDSSEKYIQLYRQSKETNLAFASVYSDLALSYSNKAEYEQGVAVGLEGKGYVPYKLGKFDQAIPSLNEALGKYMLSNDSISIAKCHYYLADCYCGQKDFASARTSGESALVIDKALHASERISADQQMLGKIFGEQGDYKTAITYFESGVMTERGRGDSLGVAKALAALGSAYTASGDADKGLQLHLEALKKIDSMQVDMSASDVQTFKVKLLTEMAGEYFLSGDYGIAIKTGEAAIDLAGSAGARKEKCVAYKTVAELQGLAGREDIQMQYMEKYIALNDSLQNEDSEQWKDASMWRADMARAEIEQAKLREQELQQQMEEAEQTAQRQLLLLVVIAFAVIVGLGIFIVVMRKRFQK